MKRKQIYITESQQKEINKIKEIVERRESEVIRTLIDLGIKKIKEDKAK